MQLPRWQKHWWEWTKPKKAEPIEPSVWVDPSLYVEAAAVEAAATTRIARGTTPPPSCVGAYCSIEPAAAED